MTKKTFETDNIKKQNINKTLLLLPTLNEVETIQKLYNEIKKLNLDIDFLFIDDGSADGTINIINDLIKAICDSMIMLGSIPTPVAAEYKLLSIVFLMTTSFLFSFKIFSFISKLFLFFLISTLKVLLIG